MVWPFGPRTFLDPDIEAWHFETWSWLLDNLGGLEALRGAPLVLANPEFFPATDKTGEDRVRHLFDQVRRHAGMEEWPCALVMQPDRPDQPAGTFRVVKTGTTEPPAPDAADGEWEGLVTYSPHLVDDPVGLVATFAHELAHFRLAYVEAEPPGGHDLHELATDLTVAFTGFGLFGAATSSRFQNRAWTWQGYLRPLGWAFALAVFQRLRGQPVEPLGAHLEARLYDDVVKAARYLDKHPERWSRP